MIKEQKHATQVDRTMRMEGYDWWNHKQATQADRTTRIEGCDWWNYHLYIYIKSTVFSNCTKSNVSGTSSLVYHLHVYSTTYYEILSYFTDT